MMNKTSFLRIGLVVGVEEWDGTGVQPFPMCMSSFLLSEIIISFKVRSCNFVETYIGVVPEAIWLVGKIVYRCR